jgi:CheY-like chemotaxis protein
MKKILWADDQIDLLQSHILFLEEKGYRITGVTNGDDAISRVRKERFDLLLLDEMMPGLNGLDTLNEIKRLDPSLPVVMITKSEEDSLMEEAIGKRISAYLVKPVNPIQVYSTAKSLLESEKIQESRVTRDYVAEFNRMAAEVAAGLDWEGWVRVHQSLCEWDREFARFRETGLEQTHEDQKKNINFEFARSIERHYRDWIHSEERPPLSVDVMRRHVLPHLGSGNKVYFFVIDCMRLDQWLEIEPLLEPFFNVQRDYYLGILPTATPYARNSIFSGLFPSEIAQRYPRYWNERSKDDQSKNRFEAELLQEQFKRLKLDPGLVKYHKVFHNEDANELRKQVGSFIPLDFVAFVFNFLDILSHGRSQSDLLKEIAPDEAAFRSLMRSWFAHSALFDILKEVARHGARIVITTDHGSILTRRSSVVYGNRDTSTNLRYKYGDNLGCDTKQALLIRKPAEYLLPQESKTKNYIMAKENFYFVYPTNMREYEHRYFGSFQHGGVSPEEMILPCITLTGKS